MKKELLGKKFRYCIVFCLLFTVLFWTHGSKVKAEELKTETVDGKGVLQAGGLLQETEDNGISFLSVEDTEGAKTAIKNGLDEHQNEIDLTQYQISKEKIKSIFQQEILNKNPKYFYVDGQFSYGYNVQMNTVTQLNVDYLYDKEKSNEMLEAYNREINVILSGVNESWSDLEKILYINDYLAVNSQYDESLEKNSAYNLLVDKTAVCQGYALAFLELMNQLGVSCELVTSDTIHHAWNAVKVGNGWYYVDVTWNDPLNDKLGRARHAYLLKSHNSFQNEQGTNTHKADDYVFTGGLAKSNVSHTEFDSYLWDSIDYVFGYKNGYWYTNVNGRLTQYKGSNDGLTEPREIKDLTGNVWMVWGSETSYYQGNYSGFGLYLDKIYYLTPNIIYSLDCGDLSGEPTEVYSLTEEEKAIGRLYAFKINGEGILTYGLAQSPSDTIDYQKEIRLHEHSFGEWTITKASTCKEKGTESRICSVCGKEENREKDLVDHTPGGEATCTTSQVCTVCETVLVKATGHSYESKITKEPTCKEKGKRTYTCGKCGDSYTEEIEATDEHSFGKWTEIKASTCKEKGIESRICSICGREENREKDLVGHTPGEEATCTIPQICTICKKTLHNAEGHKPGTAASCTTEQTCTVCHTVLAKSTGHLHTKTTKEAATFKKAGRQTTICTDCGKTIEVKKLAKITCKKNQTYKVGNYKYKIINPKTNGKGTVAFAGLNKNIAKVTIGDTVTILGAKFKITQIADKALKNKKTVTSVTLGANIQSVGKEAFYGTTKLKTITIKSQKLTKVGKNALKNIYKKSKIKVPKSKLKKYQKLFKKKGQKSTVKISK